MKDACQGIGNNMNERIFTLEVVKSLNEQGAWAYKIPDVFGMSEDSRFIPPKPFDIIGIYEGKSFAIECKQFKQYQAFGLRCMQENQIDHLTEFILKGGNSFVFLNIRITTPGRRKNELLIFRWEDLQSVWRAGSIKKAELEEMSPIAGFKSRFNLEDFLEDIPERVYN